jgi:hypothetical protein
LGFLDIVDKSFAGIFKPNSGKSVRHLRYG